VANEDSNAMFVVGSFSLGLENAHFYILHLHILAFMFLTGVPQWILWKICFDAFRYPMCYINSAGESYF